MQPGDSFLQYRLVDKLGEGGMGVVWRARDTKLERDVALKVLPVALADDPERRARFEREARSLAALHHPNVASIFGFEEAEGAEGDSNPVRFLVMEYVEGEDLAARLDRGALPLDEAVEIARRVAEGLEAAHARSIVHRDLKPANVRLGPDGQVKILDFGLARAFGDDPDESGSGAPPQHSPTITAAMTAAGTILGTAAYMSPEQARGKALDHRADIWAFGVILWEMLSGRRLFEGDTISDTLAGVLRDDIDLDALPSGTPDGLRRLIVRCLQRDPRKRLHSIADARIELEEAGDPSTMSGLASGGFSGAGVSGGIAAAGPSGGGIADDGDASVANRSRPRGMTAWLPWTLVALLAVAATVSMWLAGMPGDDADPQPLALSIEVPENMELGLIDWAAFAASPRRDAIAVTARVDGQLTVQFRGLGESGYRRLSGSGNAFGPFFSPDGRWVGYYSDGQLLKVSVDGGSPVEIAAMSHPRGASWGDDGFVYYVPGYSTGMRRRAAAGTGEEEILTRVDTEGGDRTHRWPDALPGGRGVVYTIGATDSPGDYENARLAVWDARSGESRDLGIRGAIARWSPDGRLLLMRDGVLHAVDFDLATLTVQGAPEPVFDGVRGDPASGMYYFDVNERGDLFYVPARDGGPQRRLVWIDRDGAVEPLDLPPGRLRYPRIHPDGRLAAIVEGEGHGNNDDIYLLDLDDASMNRFTFDQANIMPVWSPAGASLYFGNVPQAAVLVRDIEGASGARKAVEQQGVIFLPGSLGPDGKTLLGTVIGEASLGGIYVADLTSSEPPRPLIDTPAAEWGPDFSPDGTWITYSSDETGREEIYVQPYPPTGAKWQVSVDGGRSSRWSRDGTEIYFVQGDTFHAARVERRGSSFRAQAPTVLFDHRMDSSGVPLANYDQSPLDGRFLIVGADAGQDSRRLHVVLNWLAVPEN